MSTEPMTPSDVAIPDLVTCDASDLDFNQASSVQSNMPQDPVLQNAGWLWFNNLGVNNEAGVRLYEGETPLRVSQIRIFPADVSWRYGFSFATSVKTPLGKSIPTPSDWRYPGMARYGMVLFQVDAGQMKVWKILESDANTPQQITLNPSLDIYININDGKGSYGDNSGSFDIYIQPIR